MVFTKSLKRFVSMSQPKNFRSFTNVSLKNAVLDYKYFLDPKNLTEITENAKRRGVKQEIGNLLQKLNSSENNLENINVNEGIQRLLMWLPNRTHPNVIENETVEPVVLQEVGEKPQFHYHPATFDSLAKRLNLTRMRFLGPICESKAYYLKHDLARLERALVKYTLEKLIHVYGFQLVSVPEVLPKSVVECCGMRCDGVHSQVYKISETFRKDLCLSGTSEIALAAFVSQKYFNKSNLPLRLCAVSRCHRAEAKKAQNEKGLFRVHHFTKVEMFGVSADGNESETLLNKFVKIQKKLFSDLGLHFKVLEMPACDLGLPAYHKIDMEAWMPGRGIYGEISSASNCTDFQSRRLAIKYKDSDDRERFCHTVNGTACAVPRMLIAIFESFQNYNGSVNVPVPLQKFMDKSVIQEKFDDIMVSMKPVG